MIEFNKSRSQEFAAAPSIAEGKHALAITDIAPHEPKDEANDNLMAKVSWRKILDPSDGETIKGPTFNQWITLPLDNPDVDGHECPQWAPKMFAPFAAAVSDDVPEWPRYDRDTKETTFLGEPVAKGKDLKRAQVSCINAAGDFASELWGENGEGLNEVLGCVAYGHVIYEDGSDFPSLDEIHQECPEDWELTDEIARPFEGGDEEEEEKPRKKKTAKKKGKKKTTRRK